MWHEKFIYKHLHTRYTYTEYVHYWISRAASFFLSLYCLIETPWLAWENIQLRLYHVNLITHMLVVVVVHFNHVMR